MRAGTMGVLAFVAMLASGCYYDIEEELYPNSCNTDNVTYNTTIVAILDRDCLGCHGDLSQNGGINLDGYDRVKKHVDNGKLIGSIRHESGFSAMPQGKSKLTDCAIEKIQVWIDQGAPDN